MIKQLRRRIILVNMILTGVVLIGIFTAVCLNSYSTAKNDLQRGLSQVVDREVFDEHDKNRGEGENNYRFGEPLGEQPSEPADEAGAAQLPQVEVNTVAGAFLLSPPEEEIEQNGERSLSGNNNNKPGNDTGLSEKNKALAKPEENTPPAKPDGDEGAKKTRQTEPAAKNQVSESEPEEIEDNREEPEEDEGDRQSAQTEKRENEAPENKPDGQTDEAAGVNSENSAQRGAAPITKADEKPSAAAQSGTETASEPSSNPNEPKLIGKPDMHFGEPTAQLSSYILVETDFDGNIVRRVDSQVTMEDETLEACVKLILADGNKQGQVNKYGIMYAKNDRMENTVIALTDTSSINSTLKNTILTCLVLFLLGMVVIFLISLGLSSLSVKPVKQSWEKQKQFVADASHELKTPLTVILANNNIMLSHSPSDDERKWLESTEEEAGHMKKLIDQMLFLAKNDAGDNHEELSDVDFSDAVEGVSLNFEPVAFEKGVLIDANVTPGITVHGNSLRLNQLAHILIDNAVKYSKPDSTVTIILEKKNDNIIFSVNNQGTPIAEEDIDHIFDRFYRAEKSRTTKGYGLGLAIAKEIVSSANGKINVVSNEKDGTTFTVVF